MNIAYVTNNHFCRYLIVSLESLLLNNNQENLNIYIFFLHLSQKNQHHLRKTTEKYNSNIELITVDRHELPQLVLKHHFTIETYIRLIIHKHLDVERILYLDVDTLIIGNLNSFYNENFKNYLFCAVENKGITNDKKNQLGMSKDMSYFNGGVMLLNLKRIKEVDFFEKVVDFILNNAEIIDFADQDGMNAIIKGKYKNVSHIYNQLTYQKYERKPKIIHYAGGKSKPFMKSSRNKFHFVYFKYYKKTVLYRPVISEFSFIIHSLAFPFLYWVKTIIKRFIRRVT